MHTVFRSVLAASLILIAACGDDDDPTGPGSGNGTVSATVNGASFAGSLAVQAVYANQVLAFGAVQTSGVGSVVQFNFSLFPVTTTGQYNVGGISAYAVTYIEATGTAAQTWTTQLPGGSGTINVTTFNGTTAAGTFNLTLAPSTTTGATGTKTVTGSFSVKY